MKVLDLCCASGHVFEGWFASEDDFRVQRDRGLLDCPLCGEADVSKLPSAPRLNLGAVRGPQDHRAPEPGTGSGQVPGIGAKPGLQGGIAVHGNAAGRFVEALSDLMRSTEDVGTRFAEEARRIHYGETEQKAIRGQTTPKERAELADEGIEVYTLPLALPPKSSLQ